jgi:hypothetical protein
MRIALSLMWVILGSGMVLAQVGAPAKASDSPHSTGRTISPEVKGAEQPQGPTGPTETTNGGAPAESPQGQTPPGMQAAPAGSDKTVVDPGAAKTAPVGQSAGAGAGTPSSDGIFRNGVLAVPGVDPDNQTAPAKFSARTDAADHLPIAEYALRHLSLDQRNRIVQALGKPMAIMASKPAVEPVIGAELTWGSVLHDLQPLPGELTRAIPELIGLVFVREGDKILLASPTMQRVVAIVGN